MNAKEFTPCIQLYNHVRAGFVMQGSALATWCHDRGVRPQHARDCLIGTWNGPKGKALREEIIKASGILDTPSSAA